MIWVSEILQDNTTGLKGSALLTKARAHNLANAALSLCRMLCEHFVKTNPNLPEDDDDDEKGIQVCVLELSF